MGPFIIPFRCFTSLVLVASSSKRSCHSLQIFFVISCLASANVIFGWRMLSNPQPQFVNLSAKKTDYSPWLEIHWFFFDRSSRYLPTRIKMCILYFVCPSQLSHTRLMNLTECPLPLLAVFRLKLLLWELLRVLHWWSLGVLIIFPIHLSSFLIPTPTLPLLRPIRIKFRESTIISLSLRLTIVYWSPFSS